MATVSVPRLVGATWYPVPCPGGVPLTLGFPSEEACGAFCGAIGGVLEAFDDQLAVLEDKHADELNAAEDEAREIGFDSGYEEGKAEGLDEGHAEGEKAAALKARDECAAGRCEGYDIGWADGYAQAGEVARSAESA